MGSRGARNKQVVYEINGSSLDFFETARHAPSASARAPSRGATNKPVMYAGLGSSLQFVEAPKQASSAPSARAPSRSASNKPVLYAGLGSSLEVVEAPRKASSASSARALARASSTGSGNSAAGYKEPSNNSIYQSYGGYMNFLHCHDLRIWNPEDVDEGHRIVAEIKQHMRQEAAQASARSNANYSRY